MITPLVLLEPTREGVPDLELVSPKGNYSLTDCSSRPLHHTTICMHPMEGIFLLKYDIWAKILSVVTDFKSSNWMPWDESEEAVSLS